MGVDHVYLYDNSYNGELGFVNVLYGEDQVTLIPFPGETMQAAMMQHALNSYRSATRWLASIDMDEFLVPLKTNNLKTFLEPYERYSAVCPHWRLFGSNGERTYTSRPVLERFTRCATEADRHIKSIVDPARTFQWVTVHKYTHSTPAVDEYCRPIEESDSRPEPATADIIQLNHYVTKSFEECLERRSRSRADIPEVHPMPEFFTAHDRNDIEDLRALNFWRSINVKKAGSIPRKKKAH